MIYYVALPLLNFTYTLIVFAKKLKMGLLMRTGRTFIDRFRVFVEITAVAAAPCDFFLTFKNSAGF